MRAPSNRRRIFRDGLVRAGLVRDRLVRDSRGMAVVEFAVVAPVMILFLMGALDVSHTLYVKSVLEGTLQKAARDTALETGTSAAQREVIDARVRNSVRALNSAMTVTIDRRFYRTFGDAGARRMETYTDTNSNGRCDPGEPFDDVNSNTVRDLDGGDAGQGGAKDAVLYTVVIRYPRMLPMHRFASVSRLQELKAATLLQNQPYSDLEAYGRPSVGRCV